ncbi:hypothetical protein AMECASPLE_005615 [Ameca splendens]|uniref:Uncharacterized protein n=1 Tax=Ameca splendens TaxID=208324 RepID=A0ABV0ZIY8_9TELE
MVFGLTGRHLGPSHHLSPGFTGSCRHPGIRMPRPLILSFDSHRTVGGVVGIRTELESRSEVGKQPRYLLSWFPYAASFRERAWWGEQTRLEPAPVRPSSSLCCVEQFGSAPLTGEHRRLLSWKLQTLQR